MCVCLRLSYFEVRRENVLKDDQQAHENRFCLGETECLVENATFEESSEHGEHQEQIQLEKRSHASAKL